MAKLVIALTLFRIGQNRIRLVDLLHLLLALLDLIGVEVRMILTSHLSVCFLDLVLTGALLESQHFIIITFISHTHHLPQAFCGAPFYALEGRGKAP